eukprot:scaffold140942_cov30-Tisochrysis_lutea.AAC.2
MRNPGSFTCARISARTCVARAGRRGGARTGRGRHAWPLEFGPSGQVAQSTQPRDEASGGDAASLRPTPPHSSAYPSGSRPHMSRPNALVVRQEAGMLE